MLNKVLFPIAAACVIAVASAFASETQQYCNELYPADSYEPQERNEYIQECLSQYTDSYAVENEVVEEEATHQSEPETDYYDGTVEEYVEEVTPEEQE